MIILSITIFHTFKKLNLAVNEKELPHKLEFLVQFNEPLFEPVVLFCTHLVHFRWGVDVCTGTDEVS